jgi:hypothetical protein
LLVIATSRKDLNKTLLDMEALSIRLGALRPEDASALLRSLVPGLSGEHAAALAELCGFLPLPIRMVRFSRSGSCEMR